MPRSISRSRGAGLGRRSAERPAPAPAGSGWTGSGRPARATLAAADRRRAARVGGGRRSTTSAGPACAAGTGTCSSRRCSSRCWPAGPARYQRWDLVADTGADWVEVPLGRAGDRRGGVGHRRPGAGAVGRAAVGARRPRTSGGSGSRSAIRRAARALADRLVAERAGVRGQEPRSRADAVVIDAPAET